MENEPKPDQRTHEVVFKPGKQVHGWIQRGHTLHCQDADCPPHGHHVGHDDILTGFDQNNLPIMEKRTVFEAQNVKGPDLED